MPHENEFTYGIPAKYKHDLKVMQCRECGKTMHVGIRTRKAPRCMECGLDAMARHNTEMHEHRGEAYAKWRKAMAQFIESETPATPPPGNGTPQEPKD